MKKQILLDYLLHHDLVLQLTKRKDYEDLEKWCSRYYPELLSNFVYLYISKGDWEEMMEKDGFVPVMVCFDYQLKIIKKHCPIQGVREWLRQHRNIKTRWYHKLFFKRIKH